MKKIIAVTLLVSSMLFGAQGDHDAEISAHVGGVQPEGNLDLENALSAGLRFGMYTQDKFFDMVEFGFERAMDMEYENSTEETDVNRFFVNLIKEYDISKETALYGLAGVGYENYRNGLFDNEDEGFFNYGLGIKQWLNDDFALKAEARHAINAEGDSNLLYTLGFVIPIGKKAQEESYTPEPIEEKPEPKPEPVVEKKVVKAEKTVKDSDKDGVPNRLDQCPNTPEGKAVEKDGCMKLVRLHIKFDFDKAVVPSSYLPQIEEVADFLKIQKEYNVTLEGHTDSKGSQAYNKELSKERAIAVGEKLEGMGVAEERIAIRYFGEQKPIASNDTEEGRAKNRRVDATFTK